MKEKLTRNWGIKLFSVLFAILLWLIVLNIDNPVEIKELKIPIEFRNDTFAENDLTYTVVGSQTAVLQVPVRKKDYNRLDASAFTVWADMSQWHDSIGTVPLYVSYSGSVSIDTTNLSEYLQRRVLQIEVEELKTKEFPVTVTVQDEAPEGYTIGSVEAVPGTVYMKAPESIINIADRAELAVSLDGATGELSLEGDITIYDGNGIAIDLDNEKITVSSKTATAKINVLKTVTVPVIVMAADIEGTPAEGYRFTGATCSISEVTIAGSKTALSEVASGIVLRSDLFTINGANRNVEVDLDLNDFLPDGVQLINMDDSTVTVTMNVEALITRSFSLNLDQVSFMNPSENMSYTLSEGSYQVVLEGLKEDLDEFDASSLSGYVDVGGLGAGEYDVEFEPILEDGFTLDQPLLLHVAVEEITESQSSESTDSE